jgi:hypothetical protein
MATYGDYAQAAELLWGHAGHVATAEFERINTTFFDPAVPPVPVIIGLTAYGRCIGAVRDCRTWLESPRITLAPEIFTGTRTAEPKRQVHGGILMVADVLVHEMIHADLMLRGLDPGHNAEPWCAAITHLSPQLLGHTVTASPVKPRRIPNPARETNPEAPKTIVARAGVGGGLSQAELATWPHCQRPRGYYAAADPIEVPSW